MKADALDKRLRDLEQKHAEPAEYVLLWADDEPQEPGAERIQLKWADGLEGY
jgi:hypothetical protein